MLTGLMVADGGFEVVSSDRAVGGRRFVDDSAVAALEGFAARYQLAAPDGDAGALLALGRDLYGWLDAEGSQLSRLRASVAGPLLFEVRGPQRPSAAEWALLQAPFELLADDHGFLAQDGLLQFCVVRRLGPLGPPGPLDHFRLGLAFMASSPRGQRELDFEAEEAAILRAVGDPNMDLVVEESGDPEQLADRLAELGSMPVVHLSCHGVNRWPPGGGPAARPVLMMEDPEGNDRPTDAGELIRHLRVADPRLLFLSACLTATTAGEGQDRPPATDQSAKGAGGLVAHSLATALVQAGVPAVIGWDGSVVDTPATQFAKALYGGLARRQDLVVAVGDARRVLLQAEDELVRRDWHMARLWVGPPGGGPIVGGTRKRSMLPATHGQKAFLGKEQLKVPVASHEMFVGRRRQLQRALRVLREGDHAGVLLHGMGRLGKSSLAARIANRRKDLALAVVFEHYGVLDVMEALAVALRPYPPAREFLEARRSQVRDHPDQLEELLIDLLNGPCRQADDDGSPVLLVLDDLERILTPGPDGTHRVNPQHAAMLTAVLRAFDPAESDSRLLLTSRFRFQLDGLEARLHDIQLPPLSEVEQRKLQHRQVDVARDPTGSRSLAPQAFAARQVLAERVPNIARGNPGLQDLIGLRLVFSDQVPIDRATQVLDEMEQWLAGGELPDEAQVREFLENLAIDTLLEQAGPAGQELLRALSLFQLPVPSAVADAVASEVGGSVDGLRNLGLVDLFEDLVDPRADAVAVNALAAARLPQLSEDEQAAVVAVAVRPLFEAWGGVSGHERRPQAADLQLTLVGLAAGDAEVVVTCATDAVAVLSDGPVTDATEVCERSIALLDSTATPVPVTLLVAAAQAVARAGDGDRADELLDRAAAALESDESSDEAIDPWYAGIVAGNRGRRLMTRGELDDAHTMFKRAVELFQQAGSERQAAIARGDIADIHFMRGEFDEALRIRQEEELPVYEKLGDIRSRAVTWGQVADIHYQRGELDEALRIRQEEELPVYEKLGDIRSRAVTWGKVADIHFQRGDLDEALRIRQDVQLPVLEELGDVGARSVAWGRVASIAMQQGDLDTAYRLHIQRLEVSRRLGYVDEIAGALWDLAQIDLQRGDIESAAPRISEAWNLVAQSSRAEGIATVGELYGQLLIANDLRNEGVAVLQMSIDACRRLGRHSQAEEVAKLLGEIGEASRTEDAK